MDFTSRFQVYSQKMGSQLNVSFSEHGMNCQETVLTANVNSRDWMNGYWNDGGGSWDHNAWEDKW